MKSIHAFLPAVVLSLVILPGCASKGIEEPEFSVVEQSEAFEIRDYEPRLVAQTRVAGDQKEAGNAGFRILADYIFGNNQSQQEIAMTAPVSQAPQSEEIAMTAPVSQQQDDEGWLVQFTLPAEYTLENAPEPVNDAVELELLPAERVAVLKFSGYARVKRVAAKREALASEVESRRLEAIGPVTLAQYDPPWTLWFLRRNEVMVPIAPR